MAVFLSPVGGVAAQFFTNTGAVLTGGKLYTYAAGTTTPATTYTSSNGATPWTNPIVLDAAGRVPSGGEIWLTDGILYKFVLKDANDVLIATYDNISGINSNFVAFTNSQQIITATAGQTVFTLTTAYQPGTNSLSVFVDGVNQYGPGAQYAYTETDANTVTFNSGLHVGAEVKFTTTQQQGAGAVDASQVSYDPPFTGSAITNVEAKLAQYVSVKDFGAVGNGVADDSTAISNAIATGKSVYFPAGTYLCNVNINSKTILFGDGSTVSIIKPFAYTSPAMVYTYTAQQTPITGYWNYHSEVRNLGFQGTGSGAAATGIGFSFGSGSPTTYTTGAEYANNVTFYNCFFSKLEKGVQFPFGNIGSQFYSCGFQSNYYGVYMLDNKSGSGDAMHAGNKYFYNGEFDYNVCAVYVNNNTDGFGAISFTDTIVEYNSIGFYIKNTQITTFTPIQFKDCWYEGNGTASGATTATIDVWTGNVKTTASVPVASYILYNGQTLIDGGFATGIFLQSNNSRVYVKNSRVETNSGFGGQANSITYGDSNIFFENCTSASGYLTGSGYSGNGQCVGFNTSIDPNVGSNSFTQQSRFRFLPVSYSVRTGSGLEGIAEEFTTAQAYTGASSGTGTVVAGNSPKYANNNQFTFTYANTSQYYTPSNTGVTVNAGKWAAFTCDVFLVSATNNVLVSFSDLGSNVAGIIYLGVDSVWRTIGGVAYFPNTASVSLYFGTLGAQTAVINVSAFQCKYFATQGEAENFIASRTYVE